MVESQTSHSDRMAKMIELRAEGYTLQLISETFNLTRERVRQILKNQQIKPQFIVEYHVADVIGCSRHCVRSLRIKGITNPKRFGNAWLYNEEELAKVKKAHEENKERRGRVSLTCLYCGVEFQLRRSVYKSRMRGRKTPSPFCGRPCAIRYLKSHCRRIGQSKAEVAQEIFARFDSLLGEFSDSEEYDMLSGYWQQRLYDGRLAIRDKYLEQYGGNKCDRN